MLIQEMTCETSRNGLELMKWKFYLKIREKYVKEDNQIDNGRKKYLNREREKPNRQKTLHKTFWYTYS